MHLWKCGLASSTASANALSCAFSQAAERTFLAALAAFPNSPPNRLPAVSKALVTVPRAVVTEIGPLVAPFGTVATTCDVETTVKAANA